MTRGPITREHAATVIDNFAADITRYRAGKISDAVFLESRLRHGVYGQRQDGVHMMRSKLPLGLITAAQLEAFADVAERFGNGVAHLTTRQDIQTHFVQLEQTPAFMARLNDAGATTQQACGNVVRNIVASPLAGVDPREVFDVTCHGMALARFLLSHPDAQGLGRKVKICIAGSDDPRFDLSAIHDIGLTARLAGGSRGFRLKVGGGLGPVPHEAQVFSELVPERELLPTVQAILRVFAREGERKNRARARLKFLVARIGVEAFASKVREARDGLVHDPCWTAHLTPERLSQFDEQPRLPPGAETAEPQDSRQSQWLRTNVLWQRQPGYAVVKVRVAQGDLSPVQLRGLAALVREQTGPVARIGPDQSLYLRWVPSSRLLAVREALLAIGLGEERAGGLGDTVTCPGAETCKLGITSPRLLARSLAPTLKSLANDARLERLRIHISGCPNGCAHHHVADIGLHGGARTLEGVVAPSYVLFLGGLAGGAAPAGEQIGSGFGRVTAKIPAHRVGDAIELLCQLYLQERQESDSEPELFGSCMRRIGLARIKTLLFALAEMPSPVSAPWAYREPGSDQAFVVVRGTGEGAGCPVDQADLLLKDADREAEASTERLEAGDASNVVASHAFTAMKLAARALLATDGLNTSDRAAIRSEFVARFYDTGRMLEGVAHYFLATDSEAPTTVRGDRLRRLVVEAGLFVEEAHSMLARMQAPSELPARVAR